MPAGAIKEVVPNLLSSIGVTSKNYALISLVENELSPMNHHARVVAFKNNKIYIEVDSSVFLHECGFKKREIIRAIENAFPIDSIQNPPEIKFFLKGLVKISAEERIKKIRSINQEKEKTFQGTGKNG